MKWYSKKWFEFLKKVSSEKNFYHFMLQSFQFLRTFLIKKIVFGNVASPKNLLILAIEALYYYPFSLHFSPFLCQLCVRSMQPNRFFFVFLQNMWTFKCTCVILQSFCPKNDFLCEMKLKCCSIHNFQTSGFTSKNLCINRMESKVHGVQLNSNQFLWLNFQILKLLSRLYPHQINVCGQQQ